MRLFRVVTALAALLVTALVSYAGNVSQVRSAQAAADFFAASSQKRPRILLSLSESGSENSATVAYRAYNREGGGFVVIAGNDVVEPILAYSSEGSFPSEDEMPDNMKWWFGMLARQIEAIPDGAEATEQIKARWADPANAARSGAAALLYDTALWDQDKPYNNKCPMSGNTRCITGCVATAGAIVSRYFQWPDHGEGTVPARGDDNTGAYFAEHTLGHEYDWANMPADLSGGYTEAQAEAISTLIYDMGTIAKMQYGTKLSSAYSSDLLSGMKTYMKFNKGAYLAHRDDYSDEQWIVLMKKNLQECGPSVYSGQDVAGQGGHSFVVDGYDESDRFHFNWGWGGDCNCYCFIPQLKPTGSRYEFSNSQELMVNLVPDRTGTSTGYDNIKFYEGTLSGHYCNGISSSTESYKQNVQFYLSAGWLEPTGNAFSGNFYFALYDKFGNFKQDISSALRYSITFGFVNRINSASCKITTTIEPGDRIKLRYEGQYNAGIVEVGAGCVTEIIVMEEVPDDPAANVSPEQIANTTSLSYNRSNGQFTIILQYPANWSVTSSGGTVVSSGVAADGGSVTIDTSSLSSGVYTISLGSLEHPFKFSFTK